MGYNVTMMSNELPVFIMKPIDIAIYDLQAQYYDTQLYVFDDFLSPEECEMFIRISEPNMERSTGGTHSSYNTI
jgi:hypothetical protein